MTKKKQTYETSCFRSESVKFESHMDCVPIHCCCRPCIRFARSKFVRFWFISVLCWHTVPVVYSFTINKFSISTKRFYFIWLPSLILNLLYIFDFQINFHVDFSAFGHVIRLPVCTLTYLSMRVF